MSRLKQIAFRWRQALPKWLLASVLLAASGSSTDAETKATAAFPLVWPSPPDEPRIAYVRSISSPADAGTKVSGFRRFTNWLAGAHEGNESLSHPFGIAIDEQGDLCITDTGANAVCYFDHAAKHWYRWEEVGGVHFACPVAIVKKGKTIFVADSSIPAIVAVDLKGKPLFRTTEGVKRATGLALSGNRLLAADAEGHCIAIFDLSGKFLSRFGTRGTGPGQFNYPTHVTADLHGSIYVTDSVNGRVQVFSSDGTFKRQIGVLGDSPGCFSRPKGVAVDAAGHVYVSDAMFDNFQIFDSEGRLLLGIGHQGAAPGEFYLPNGMAVGPDNLIYVADSFNGRIQVFKPVDKK